MVNDTGFDALSTAGSSGEGAGAGAADGEGEFEGVGVDVGVSEGEATVEGVADDDWSLLCGGASLAHPVRIKRAVAAETAKPRRRPLLVLIMKSDYSFMRGLQRCGEP